MSVTSATWPHLKAHFAKLLQNNVARYLFALAAVAIALVIRILLVPVTGKGAPFVLFFAATLVTSLCAGIGPGLVSLLVGVPLAASAFVLPAGYSASQAAFQALFYSLDGFIILYLTHLMRSARRDLQETNRKLRRREEERQIFAALIENSSDFIGIADPSGKPLYLNPAGRKMVGLSADYPVEQTQIPEYYPPSERSFASGVIVKAMLERGHWSGETYFRHWKTEEAIPVSDTHFLIRDASGQRIIGMGTVTRDISEARRESEQLRESEERFRLTIDEAPIGMALVALDGRFVRVNRALSEIVGYTPAELTGMTFQAITHPDDLETDLALVGRLTRGEIPTYQLEKRYLRKDGTSIDILLSASLLRHRDGAPLYYVAQIQDISDRKRLERSLRESHADLNRAQSVAKLGSWRLDIRRNSLRWSDETYRIFGIGPGTPMSYAAFLDSVHPDDRTLVDGKWNAALRGEPYDIEHRIIVNGTLKWVREKADLRFDEQGALQGGVGIVQDITEAKRAEEALKRSEQDFRSLAESLPQIVWATRPDGHNIYFNQQWVDYTGLTLEQSYGEGWIKPFHPDDRQRAWDAWQRATKYRETYSLECRLRRADGAYQWWLIRGVPLLDANGEITKWFGTCTDIEQIKIAEQRLKESEAKFSGIVSISADAIISIDEAQRITIFNDGAEKTFGYSKTEAIGAPLDILIPERFREIHGRHVASFAAGTVTARGMGDRSATIAGLRKSGEEFPAEAAISKLQVGDKALLTVALRDITERTRVEKEQRFLAEAGVALSASLDYEQTLATVARLSVRDFADWCVVDIMEEHEHLRRLKVVSADPAKADVCTVLEQVRLDRDRPHLMRPAIESKAPLLIENVTSQHLESFAQGTKHLQALRALEPRSLMLLPLLRHEQLLGVLAFISSSRAYGPADLRLAETLAERASVAIENARLYRSSVEATHLRDQVLGVVAHDLRNPLTTILMQAATMQRRGSESALKPEKSGQIIHRAATRMNRLIQDLLDVARLEAGQLRIDRVRVSATALVSEAVEMQKALATSSSVELRLDVGSGVWEMWGDHDRLLQVFENLIGNAIKFTGVGGRITVGAASKEQEIMFWVADSGCGIASDALPHVFDRFWQATTGDRRGAGLGLPIVKGIVEAHGGHVWAESTLGRGSTFFFSIPTATPAEDRPAGTVH